MTEMFYQRIRQKLDELGITDREASMKVSGTPDLIRNIKRGKSETLRGPRLLKLAALLNVSPAWLQTGEHDHISSEEVAASLDVQPNRSRAYAREHYQPKNPGGLPELDVMLGAGNGNTGEVLALPIGGESYSGHKVVAEWLFPDRFIRSEAKASVSNTVVLPVTGDSMLPNYNYGDRVLVDLSQNVFLQDGVYAISDGHTEPRIKRLQYIFNSNPQRVRIISDNPIYAPEEHLLADVTIIGRVCGIIARR